MFSRLLLVALLSISATAQHSESEAYVVVHGWPVLPEGYMLGQVSGVAVDTSNRVYVFHRGEHSWSDDKSNPISSPTILSFDGTTGKMLTSWGANIFLEPHGLRIDPSDNIWVTDIALHQVLKFSHDGKLLMVLGTAHAAGQDATHFNMPSDIAFGNDGSFYVADGEGNNRVAKFSADGKFLW